MGRAWSSRIPSGPWQTRGRPAGECLSQKGRGALEQLLYGVDMPPVREEQDEVIVRLHRGVVVRDDDVITPHHGSQGGAFWQGDVLDAAADDLGAVRVAVHHHFQSLRGTAPQR